MMRMQRWFAFGLFFALSLVCGQEARPHRSKFALEKENTYRSVRQVGFRKASEPYPGDLDGRERDQASNTTLNPRRPPDQADEEPGMKGAHPLRDEEEDSRQLEKEEAGNDDDDGEARPVQLQNSPSELKQAARRRAKRSPSRGRRYRWRHHRPQPRYPYGYPRKPKHPKHRVRIRWSRTSHGYDGSANSGSRSANSAHAQLSSLLISVMAFIITL